MRISVPDVEQAIAFFVNVIGCDLLWRDGPIRDDTRPSMVEGVGTGARSVLHLAMVRCGSDSNVELLQYQGDPDAVTAEPRNIDAAAIVSARAIGRPARLGRRRRSLLRHMSNALSD